MPLLAFLAATLPDIRSSLLPDLKHVLRADQSVPERYRGHVIINKPKGFKEKVIALSFDDGPDPKNTPYVLGQLARYDARATFFVIGSYANRHPKLVAHVAARGHVIGSHTWSHPATPAKRDSGREVWKTARAIHVATGVWPSVFRPPYGIRDSWPAKIARKERYGVVLWNRSSADTSPNVTAQEVSQNVLCASAGDVVLMHDGPGRDHTVKALPSILKGLKRRGYTAITVPDMLRRWDAYLTKKDKARPANRQSRKR